METATFPSAGETLYRSLTSAGAPRAVLVTVHGYAEHHGRYARLTDELVGRGFAVFGFDYRGHGHATGARGHCNRFTDFVADLSTACEEARRLVPGKPIGLLTASHGALVTLRALCDPQTKLDVAGAVLTSPFLGVALAVPGWKTVLGRAASRLAPKLSMPNGIRSADLSHDPKVGAAYDADPFVHHVATARWFTEMSGAHDYVRAHAARLAVPTLWLLAGDDRVASTPASEAVYAAAGGDKTFRRFDRLYHELYNEPEPDRATVVADLFSWLDGRFPSA
ncbi:MAG TPA: lysophospholipase [Haliangiales bacterium]|nr:lysophospholipase [Haliangiales bacterium]